MIKKNLKLIAIAMGVIILIFGWQYHYKQAKSAKRQLSQYVHEIKVSVSIPKGSVVCEPKGGIGNQLFQYAAAYSLAKKTDSKLFVLIAKNSEKAENNTPLDRNFSLHSFNIPKEQILYYEQISKRKTSSNVQLVDDTNFFDIASKKNNKVLYINDYFESEIYFKDFKQEILNLFSFSKKINPNLAKTIELVSNPNSFCVHVRRGDMLKHNYGHFLPIDYQKQAISLINEITKDPKFIIFSDSINIVKKELSGIANVEFINNAPLDDFMTMSKCGNIITANSTFSWWAAYLNNNPQKLIIAPNPRYNETNFHYIFTDKNKRYNKHRLYYANAYPKDWVQLEYNSLDLLSFVKEVIPDQHQQQTLTNSIKQNQFSVYSGDMRQLQICKGQGNFSDNICYVDNTNIKPTVVTAFYRVKNKHRHDQFKEWMTNFLRIPFNLVVFTDKANAQLIRDLRGDLPLVLIEKELTDFYHYQYYEQYQEMHKYDDNLKHSPELYMVWAEKVKFVNQAIKLDPYKSKFFIWTDIGMMREQEYLRNDYPNITHIPSNKMSFFAMEDFNSLELFTKVIESWSVRIAGSPQIGDKISWQIYDNLWDLTVKDLLAKNFSTRNDQAVIGSIILRYPKFFNLIYPDILFGRNLWWYSLLYLSNNNNLVKKNEQTN